MSHALDHDFDYYGYNGTKPNIVKNAESIIIAIEVDVFFSIWGVSDTSFKG